MVFQFKKIKTRQPEVVYWETRPIKSAIKQKEKIFDHPDGNFSIVIRTDDQDLLNSNSLFKRFGQAVLTMLTELNAEVRSQSHSQKEIIGQVLNRIEQILPNGNFLGTSFADQKKILLEGWRGREDKVAEVLLYVHKRLVEMKAHQTTFELLNALQEYEPKIRSRNLRRAILNIWHAFDEQMTTMDLRLSLKFNDDLEIPMDFRMVDSALYNLFDNATKYAVPSSEIQIRASDKGSRGFYIGISMYSYPIAQHERERIFEFGYRGERARREEAKGNGVGLYVCRKALGLTGMKIATVQDSDDTKYMTDDEGVKCPLNWFNIESM